jgi:polysaccharide biosynthesis/export protein
MCRSRLLIFVFIVLISACTPQEKIVYFQGQIPPSTPDSTYKVRIYPGDILSINIFTINIEAYPYLSMPNEKNFSDNRSPYEKGYVVNEKGQVKLPLIDTVSLNGMTISEAIIEVENRFRAYIKDPIVTIKKLSFKVTLLGEVNKPGVYSVMNEKISLPEALGLAGDLASYGDRERIRIIREEHGTKKDIYVNLTDASSLTNEKYYLHPDDIIYVPPLPKKAYQNTYPSVALITSLITTTVVVLTFIVIASE